MDEPIYCDIRCVHQTFSLKYKRYLTCNNLVVRVTPGSSGEAWCWKKDERTNIKHGTFYFEIDPSYVPPPKKIIKVKKPD